MNIYQQMGSAKARTVSQMSFTVLDRLQNAVHPGTQILSVVIIAIKICEKYGIQLKDAEEYATRMLYSKEGYVESEFRALQTYIDKELA